MELNMDRFTGLEVFAKVVEGASFAAAGRHFGISPAMVTKHVQTLEERLGVRLLNRTTHRVSATEVGKSYYEHCLRIIAELEEADGTARDLQTAPRGLLKVTAPVSFGSRQLAPEIAEYLESYPGVSVDLSLENSLLHEVSLILRGRAAASSARMHVTAEKIRWLTAESALRSLRPTR
jgi:DNA-binding transcriptional LysR family regulator